MCSLKKRSNKHSSVRCLFYTIRCFFLKIENSKCKNLWKAVGQESANNLHLLPRGPSYFFSFWANKLRFLANPPRIDKSELKIHDNDEKAVSFLSLTVHHGAPSLQASWHLLYFIESAAVLFRKQLFLVTSAVSSGLQLFFIWLAVECHVQLTWNFCRTFSSPKNRFWK